MIDKFLQLNYVDRYLNSDMFRKRRRG